jgi:hypothetical protein
MDCKWRAAHPNEAWTWFSLLDVPWWIAGGWALDLYLAEQIRDHSDLDIGVLRRDIAQVLAVRPSWEIFEAKEGVLTKVRVGELPRQDVHSLWCRPAGVSVWTVELMLDESADESWLYRRHKEIRRSLTTVIQRSDTGLPFLAPEIQLLYKSKQMRARDQIDFDRIAPRLTASARAWLLESLECVEPEHRWLRTLRQELA